MDKTDGKLGLEASNLPEVSHFLPSSSEKTLAMKPLSETTELIFAGVSETPDPQDPGPAKAEGGTNTLAERKEEAEAGQAEQAKVQGDTSQRIGFQAVPSERAEVGQALCLTAKEEDCFQILGR